MISIGPVPAILFQRGCLEKRTRDRRGSESGQNPRRDRITCMVLSLSISAEAEAKLKAKTAGVDVETYAARHLELIAAPPKLLKDISGPIGEAFARSDMSEDELSDFLDACSVCDGPHRTVRLRRRLFKFSATPFR